MLFTRPLASVARCTGCQVSVLESLFSISSTCPRISARSVAPRPRAVRGQRRNFRGAPVRQSAQSPGRRALENGVEEEHAALRPEENEALHTEAPAANSLPWYLQVQTPQEDPKSLAERQRLPDIPSDSPSILQPLLQHISIDLGLDNLSLLDLRGLEPPPALGANLFMIIGSARSEKHLHVSADRLCRWLRSTYKLNPFADGLLGRNELKLKMRRKARRSRLMSSVGALDTREADDGIRTGWVCVNMGRVEDLSAPEEDMTAPGFVGFGRRSEGARVVVQMFTEEKRAELDLEGLWEGILRSNAKRRMREAEQAKDAMASTGPSVNWDLGTEASMQHSSHVRPNSFQIRRAVVQSNVRERGFHSCARRLNVISSVSGVSSRQQEALGANLPSGPSKAVKLRNHLERLKELSRVEALAALGQDANDISSTAFLSAFHSDLPQFPELVHWECMIDLYCHAIALGHHGYPKSGLRDLLWNMQVSGADMSEAAFTNTFQAMLQPNRARPSQPFTEYDLHMAIDVLEEMENHGYNALTEETFLGIHEVLTYLYPSAPSPGACGNAPSVPIPESLDTSTWPSRLSVVMDLAPVHLTRDSSYILLLRTYAHLNDWTAFWETWRRMPRTFYPRSATLYTFMFRTMAEKGHQSEAMRALRMCIPEMDAERPRVELAGEVAHAVMDCLEIAEPEIAKKVKELQYLGPGRAGEWVSLWRRCRRVLRRENGEQQGQRQGREQEPGQAMDGQPA